MLSFLRFLGRVAWRLLGGTTRLLGLLTAAAVVSLLVALAYWPEPIRAKLEELAPIAPEFLMAPLPEPEPVKESHWLEQNWTGRQRYWFHHATQGTATLPVPYDFFLSLEQPRISLLDAGRLADIDYLRRFGFIDSPTSIDGAPTQDGVRRHAAYGYSPGSLADTNWPGESLANKDGLPVGFARLPGERDPETGKPYTAQLGFTCAACHTGHIRYNNVSIRFDGGPAMIDLGRLEKAVGLSIAYTLKLPLRLGRFTAAVRARGGDWKDRSDKEIEDELRRAFAQISLNLGWSGQVLRRSASKSLEEGFGRLDALNRIGNQVFFENLLPADAVDKVLAGAEPGGPRPDLIVPPELAPNFASLSAPVSFPPIWTTPWFSWAQYDASIANELVRNAGEALGVNAKINLIGKDNHYRSSVQMTNIYRFEDLLRGRMDGVRDRRAFAGLSAPKWSDAADKLKDQAWSIDQRLVDKGRELYRKHCVECHRGPVRDSDLTKTWPRDSFWDAANWMEMGDRSYYVVIEKRLSVMGTDPQQARVLTTRQVQLPAGLRLDPAAVLNEKYKCGLPATTGETVNFALALMAVVDLTIDKWFADDLQAKTPVPPDVAKRMRGPRDNCPNPNTFRVTTVGGQQRITTVPHYRARPLDGVWATAPYLHNGSVPTLFAMLSPQKERPTIFCVGSRRYDPKHVGLADDLVMDPDHDKIDSKDKLDKKLCPPGLTRFDARVLGNSNRGHSFEGTETDIDKLPLGVIGPAFSDQQRLELIEYLKTL